MLGFDADGEIDSGSSSGERTIDSSSSVNSFYSKFSRQEFTYENDEMVICAPVIGPRCIAQRRDSSLHSYGKDVSPFFSSSRNALMLSISIISIVAFASLISEMREEHDTHSHP